MFDKLKQLKQLKGLKDSLSQEKAEVEKKGIKIIINGEMEIEEIHLNPDLNKEEQEEALKACINEAMKKVQMVVAKKISQTPGFGIWIKETVVMNYGKKISGFCRTANK